MYLFVRVWFLARIESTRCIFLSIVADDPVAWCIPLSACHAARCGGPAERIEVLFGV